MRKNRINSKGFTLGELIIVFAVVITAACLMIPLIHYTRQKTDRMLCANNLRQVGLGLYIYAKEHEGKFPDSLKTLYDEKYLDDPKYLVCPAAKGSPGNVDESYVYTAGLSVKSASKEALVSEKPGNHASRDWENVLYVDGEVVWEKAD